MKMVIRLSARQELKALPILLRHSTGMVLADRTYVVSGEAVGALLAAGVRFAVVCSEANPPELGRARSSKRDAEVI
jgi:hypothetical protein